MMKKIGLSFIFLIICFCIIPCLVFAQETGAPIPDTEQPEAQTMEAPSIPIKTADENVAAPDNLETTVQVDTQTLEAPSPPGKTAVETITDPDNMETASVNEGAPEGQPPAVEAKDESNEFDESSDYEQSEEEQARISDPLEPINRAFFVFNDKLYYWFLKPVAKGYKAVAPEPVRRGIRSFFSNLSFPIRFVNCLLQLKFTSAGYEFERFYINSTLGLAGFIDMADKEFGVKPVDEDFGQTLGYYGLGQGFYINWPFFGPSTVLETVGLAGDYFLEPVYQSGLKIQYQLGAKGYKVVNSTSLDDYYPEDLRDAALDPYIAFREAYIQHRKKQIKE
jgi:phospholipid-binding lipoprotein MlaA